LFVEERKISRSVSSREISTMALEPESDPRRPPPIGHNSNNAPRLGSPDHYAALTAEINEWVEAPRVLDEVAPETIGALESGLRTKALHAALQGAVQAYHRIVKSSVRKYTDIALLIVIALYSDNDHGCCWLSIKTLADLIGVHHYTAKLQLRVLAEMGLIRRSHQSDLRTVRRWIVASSVVTRGSAFDVLQAMRRDAEGGETSSHRGAGVHPHGHADRGPGVHPRAEDGGWGKGTSIKLTEGVA
jgi:hypothetical protein